MRCRNRAAPLAMAASAKTSAAAATIPQAAALTAALVLGPRKGFPTTPMLPHNMTLTVAGAGMLWVGWFGFNGGSAIAANGDAGMAMFVTHISASAGAFTWMVIEWIKEAIMERDTARMVELMDDPFNIGYWLSEGQELSAAEAADELAMGWIIPGNPLSFVDGADLATMLGMDPLTMWSPDVEVSSVFLALGWGSNASSEAIIRSARSPSVFS